MRSKNTDLMNEIKKFAEEYYLEYWKSPSTSEIAGAVGVTRATVYRYLKDMAERGMIDYDGSESKPMLRANIPIRETMRLFLTALFPAASDFPKKNGYLNM